MVVYNQPRKIPVLKAKKPLVLKPRKELIMTPKLHLPLSKLIKYYKTAT